MSRILIAVAAMLGATAPAWAGPGDLFTEKVNDFGTTPRGTVLVHYFRFTNTTNQTLTVGSPRVSCGRVSASMSKSQIAPGESAAVIAYMDTRRITTPNTVKSVMVYVPFTGPTHEEVTLRVQTVARDDLLMSPDRLALGTIKAGAGGKASTKVTFMSDPSWTITEATGTGGFVKATFKEEARNGGMVTYEVTGTVEKDCPVGNWTSDIFLKTSNPAVAKLRVEVTVNVTPALAITPEAVAFDNLPMGVATEKKVTIKGGTPFKILDVKGADDQLKVVVNKGDEASETHTVIVAANPKAPGGFTRNVEIMTDNKDQPKLVIPVTAKVIAK